MSISLLFLSAPQIFPEFHLILIPVKTGVSGFANWIVRFLSQICPVSIADSNKFFWTCPVILLDMFGLSVKSQV
jgi:hypothetical protein